MVSLQVLLLDLGLDVGIQSVHLSILCKPPDIRCGEELLVRLGGQCYTLSTGKLELAYLPESQFGVGKFRRVQ